MNFIFVFSVDRLKSTPDKTSGTRKKEGLSTVLTNRRLVKCIGHSILILYLINKELNNTFMFHFRTKKERNEMYHYINHPDSKGNKHLITSF